MSTNLAEKTVRELRLLLEKKEVSAVDIVNECLAATDKQEKDVHAYREVFDDVEAQAKVADEKRAAGNTAPLLGIPLALKDNILVSGRSVGASSKILEGYRATYDATVVTKLKESGAVFFGRTNCDEFAMGSSTENSAYGVTTNPYDRTRVAGGSSGGSAAAVAMKSVPLALGSDTGGSIRQPAALCGVVGLKPTYGSVSRHGLIAMGSSLDVIGPFSRTVDDAETLFRVIRGHDAMDSTTLPDTPLSRPKKTMTIGVPRSFIGKGVDEDVLASFEQALQRLRDAGHSVCDIELPILKYALPAYYVIMPAEASSNLARFDGVRYGLHVNGTDRIDDYRKTRGAGFGKEVRRRILLGTYVLSAGYYDAYYGKAMAARREIVAGAMDAFTHVDAIATPTSPTPAFKVGEKADDPLSMYLADIFTVSANIIGVPAISVPAGTVSRDGNELPVGFQLMAPHQREDTLFALGKVITGEVQQ